MAIQQMSLSLRCRPACYRVVNRPEGLTAGPHLLKSTFQVGVEVEQFTIVGDGEVDAAYIYTASATFRRVYPCL